ncbi:molecular chaperone MKKS [Lepeophtheirus salmonis]|uniref:molecular chaperone MKKS n=1 Tax=Lepeophtheirus salmonis TaxID=72036 RepID=UPI001AE7A3D5|nr:uncharacterized protein LOC121117341 [Lepeophtheirus salmonis]
MNFINYTLPFIDNYNLELLRTFYGSSLGPYGHLKSITNAGGNSIVSSSSLKIISTVEFEDPSCHSIAETIKEFVKYFRGGGLTLGTLISDLLLVRNEIRGFDYAVHIFPILESIKIPFEIGSLNHLQSYIRSTLTSKKWLLISKEAESLENALIEAFLKSIPDEEDDHFSSSFVDIEVKSKSGKYFSSVYNGYLYSLSHIYQPQIKALKSGDTIRSVALNILLDDDISKVSQLSDLKVKDVSYNPFQKPYEYAIRIAQECNRLGVNVIANQKVMSQSIIDYFQDSCNIFVLDRLGTKGIHSFSKLSNSKICTSAQINEDDIGILDGVEIELIGQSLYLRCWSETRPLITLFVGQVFEDASDELQDMCRNILFDLRSISLQSSPFILPGAGCTESKIFACLSSMNKSIIPVANVFRRLALRLTGEKNACIDKTHHHLWVNPYKNCQCGLLLHSNSTELVPIQENEFRKEKNQVDRTNYRSCIPSVIDSFHLKRKIIETAFERQESFSSIELTIVL